MPALSFQHQFLNALLRGDKQQTTRWRSKIKAGDVVHIYISQRQRITDKPEQKLTDDGLAMMMSRYDMTARQELLNVYHAHFLGKAKITEVYYITPFEMSLLGRERWAQADGFYDYLQADAWFTKRYGDDWIHKTWIVPRWDEWAERYFEPSA